MKAFQFELEVGSWVKVAKQQTIVNGRITALTESYFVIEGLPPLPRDDWAFIIVTPPEGKVKRIRDAD